VNRGAEANFASSFAAEAAGAAGALVQEEERVVVSGEVSSVAAFQGVVSSVAAFSSAVGGAAAVVSFWVAPVFWLPVATSAH